MSKTLVASENVKNAIQNSLGALAVGVGFVAIVISPLGGNLETTLTLHMMVEHTLLMAGGYLMAYGVERLLTVSSIFLPRVRWFLRKLNPILFRYGWIAVAVVILVVIYWHIPSNFDQLATNESLHVQMHLTFIGLGSLLFLGLKHTSLNTKWILLIASGIGMMAFGGFMLFDHAVIYSSYPFPQQADEGAAMLVSMTFMDLLIGGYLFYVKLEKLNLQR
jgi:cytochrome c oxidase assembly factor CtaG